MPCPRSARPTSDTVSGPTTGGRRGRAGRPTTRRPTVPASSTGTGPRRRRSTARKGPSWPSWAASATRWGSGRQPCPRSSGRRDQGRTVVDTHERGKATMTESKTDSRTDERGALYVTADSVDPRFNQPYIDVRDGRDEPADAPVFAGGITTQQGGAAPFTA